MFFLGWAKSPETNIKGGGCMEALGEGQRGPIPPTTPSFPRERVCSAGAGNRYSDFHPTNKQLYVSESQNANLVSKLQ